MGTFNDPCNRMPQILSVSVLIPQGRVTHFGTLLTPSQVGSSTEATDVVLGAPARHGLHQGSYWSLGLLRTERNSDGKSETFFCEARILFGVFGPGASPGATITCEMMAGWWFGTFFIFHFIYGIIMDNPYKSL